MSLAQRDQLARNSAFVAAALEEQMKAIDANNREALIERNTPPLEEQSTQTVSQSIEQRAPLFREMTQEQLFDHSPELHSSDRQFIRHHIEYLRQTFSRDQAYVFFASTNFFILVEKDPQQRITVKTSKTREPLLPELDQLKAARAQQTNFTLEGMRTSLRVIAI